MNSCRLCGKIKSPLDFIVELGDKTYLNWSYRELIEHHTRVSIKTDKLLSQSVCEECRLEIDKFAKFSRDIQIIQNKFEVKNDVSVRECYGQLEKISYSEKTPIVI